MDDTRYLVTMATLAWRMRTGRSAGGGSQGEVQEGFGGGAGGRGID